MSRVSLKSQFSTVATVRRLTDALAFVDRLRQEPTKFNDYEYESFTTRLLNAFSLERDSWGLPNLYVNCVPLEMTYVKKPDNAETIVETLNNYFDEIPKPQVPSTVGGRRVTGFIIDEDENCGLSVPIDSYYLTMPDSEDPNKKEVVGSGANYSLSSYLTQIRSLIEADLETLKTNSVFKVVAKDIKNFLCD